MLSAKEAKEIADISDMAYPDYYGDIHTVLELIKECAEKGHVRIGFQKLGYLATLHLIGLGYEVEVVGKILTKLKPCPNLCRSSNSSTQFKHPDTNITKEFFGIRVALTICKRFK